MSAVGGGLAKVIFDPPIGAQGRAFPESGQTRTASGLAIIYMLIYRCRAKDVDLGVIGGWRPARMQTKCDSCDER